jgi:hypothetical protein
MNRWHVHLPSVTGSRCATSESVHFRRAVKVVGIGRWKDRRGEIARGVFLAAFPERSNVVLVTALELREMMAFSLARLSPSRAHGGLALCEASLR